MAVVLDALASYIQSMLTKMVEEEVHLLLGVPIEIKNMTTKLGDLKRFLADADKRTITSETVAEWVREFRGAMYDATDILDLCQLKAMEEQGPSREMGCFKRFLFCIRDPFHAHDIGIRLKDLNQKIDDIVERSKKYNFIDLTSNVDNGRKNESSRPARRETTGEIDNLAVVGQKIEEATRNLVELLTRKQETIREHKRIMVFAIVGAGGIGKTTLAQNIFNNEIIKAEFGKKIWLSVYENFSEHELLKRTIAEAGGNQNAAGITKSTLVNTLKAAFKDVHKPTLVVMDDVWDLEAWEHVLKSPLTDVLAPGSRVLVTTRDDKVAQGMKAQKPYHHVDRLEPEDAWSLLKKLVVNNEDDESMVDRLMDIGMEIVARCDGLPLAVKVMGGVLLQDISRSYWETILNDSIWSESQMPEELNNAIYLSYEDLPSSLKPCFLHFSLLPKSAEFFVDAIVGMWISEGFVHGDSSCDFEKLGRQYYDELIRRNLIEPSSFYVDNCLCSMHDVVRSFARYVARDEALAAQSSQTDIIDKLNSQKFIRRIFVESKGSESEQLELMSLETLISLRTLISVGPTKIKPGDSLVTFSCLRTLHVQDTSVHGLVESVVQLKHLRYLSINNTDTSRLPENIGNEMKFLEYISLKGCKSLVKLPDSIGNLRHLRHLSLTDTFIDNVPKGFSGLTNLRKLYGFPAYTDGDWCSLEELVPLSNLTELSIFSLGNMSSTSLFVGKARLREKVRLRMLDLNCRNSRHGEDGRLAEQQQIEEVFDELCPSDRLEDLGIYGYFGQKLPRWMSTTAIASLASLRILFLEDLPCCTEVPDSLCQLPCLEHLSIKSAPLIKTVGPELLQQHPHSQHPIAPENLSSAVKVVVVNCPALVRIGNLPKTKELKIISCPKLKVLEGMPMLQILKLQDYKMKTLPGYLQDVKPKQLLQIDCDISLLTSIAAEKSGPEWDKFCHVRQVKAYVDDDDNNIERKWYVLYTRDPFTFRTNISCSDIARARREHVQHKCLAFKTCPVEEELVVSQVCTDKRHPLCQRFRCTAYFHLVPWLRKVCLHCCEAGRLATSSDQWTEATLYYADTRILLTPEQFSFYFL